MQEPKETSTEEIKTQLLPVLSYDEGFLYPFMITPIFVSDEHNILSINSALENGSDILISALKDEANSNDIDFDSLYDYGVIGTVMRRVSLADGRIKILFQGKEKGRIIKGVINEKGMLSANVQKIEPKIINSPEIDASFSVLKEKVNALAVISNYFPNDLLKAIEENEDINRVCDLVLSSIKPRKEMAYVAFKEDDTKTKILMIIEYILDLIESNRLQKEIKSKVHSKIDQTNKEYFLKEQMKQIQKELGNDAQRDEEIARYKEILKKRQKHMGKDAYKEIKKQIERLSRMHPDTSESNTIQSYLDWVVEIPFGELSKQKMDITEVKKHLDTDHYSLEKPKNRIEEYFAVKELREKRKAKDNDKNGAILCFAGPPGVGKTSLANSIAKSLKRELIRVALGGLEDTNELRGHRRTYVGAMPGRIVQGIIEAKQMNPVVVLDEIDKVAKSFRGDPTSVLLEVLDPEQNTKFRDYYLNFNIDLSNVIFIATANNVSNIPAPLRDRMEFINLSSYTPQEKLKIFEKYLLPQELKKHALEKKEVAINKSAMELIISDYTREPGVRNLRRRIAEILRKIAKMHTSSEVEENEKTTITTKNLSEYLEKKVFEIETKDKNDQIGIVNGLAWTSVGGDVLKIETIKIKGKGAITLTGQLGDVMKESTKIAQSVIKVLIDNKKIKIDIANIPQNAKEKEDDKKPTDPSEIYHRYDLHLHAPEGATPKDGPSAGIAMATVMASIYSETKIRSDVAMTGELTLRGKVLPIGGLKEKLIAAYKAKMNTVIIPIKNYERDLDDIPDEVKEKMEIIGVSTIEEVLKIALV